MNNRITHIFSTKKSYLQGVGLMLIFFLIASITQYKYSISPDRDLDIKSFQLVLNNKIEFADKELAQIKKGIIKKAFSINSHSKKNGVSFYIYQNDSLRFWNENEIGAPSTYQNYNSKSAFLSLLHTDCIYRKISFDNYHVVALIRIRNNYSNPNDYLRNDYVSDFKMDNQIEIRKGNSKDKYAIFSPENEYLFSLDKENSSVFNKTYSFWSMMFWILGICFFYALTKNSYILFSKKKPTLANFGYTFGTLSILVYLGIYFNEPWMIFSQDFFDPIYYASGRILNSLGNLSIVSLFLLAEISFLFRRVDFPEFHFNKKKTIYISFIINIISIAFFALISWLINSLIYNSSFEITLYKLENISPISILAIFLIISWIIGFILLRLRTLQLVNKQTSLYKNLVSNLVFFVLSTMLCYIIDRDYILIPIWYLILSTTVDYIYYKNNKHISLSNLSGVLILCTCFIVHYSVSHSNLKLKDKYKALAENINSGEIMDRNTFAEILFEEMETILINDSELNSIANKKYNVDGEIQNYLMKNYFRGFWSNYDIKSYLFNKEEQTKAGLERNSYYTDLLMVSQKITDTSFYFCNNDVSKMDYIGAIDLDNEILYIEFYSKFRTSSYSYPEPLLNTKKSKSFNKSLSIARYNDKHIISQVGDYEFPEKLNWIENSKDNFYSFTENDFIHYIYKSNKRSTIVLSQAKAGGYYVYIVFGAYLFTLYFILLFAVYGAYTLRHKRINQQLSFLSRLQTVFVFLMIVSFLSIFIFSVNYIIQQYETKQNNELQNKSTYIQKYIQGSLKQYENLKETNVVDLNFFLQDLSNTYETDIHIYDNNGFLVASSQPIIFAKGLISYRISPIPFFNPNKEITQTENIGKLNYLSAYTRIYNQNDLLLGYIAVPSFLSSNEIQKQVFSLLAVIINVYLFIIFIAVLVSYIVNNQLTKPIKDLENKIKSYSLKGRNEKLEYKRNDEIGRLVSQYNIMIEKLEKSANMLAQSEREMAWKQMARQITHEINNPLTPMKLTIQQLLRMQEMKSESFDEYFKKSSQMLIEQIENLSKIASSFSDFAKMPEAKQERVNILSRLESVVNLFINNHESITINYKPNTDELFVLADKEQLTQIFNNLIKNAIQAIPSNKKGIISISTQVKYKHILIQIKDNGSGISEDAEGRLFAPNFTTKSSGMGLGLAIVKNIIESSGGKIWFETKKDVGTSFHLEFPLC